MLLLLIALQSYVDTHVHIGGMADSMPKGPSRKPPDFAKEYNEAADALVKAMDERGIAKSLVVVVPPGRRSAAEETKLVVDAVKRHPDRLRMMSGGAELMDLFKATPADAVTHEARAKFKAAAERIIKDGAAGFGEMLSLHFGLGETHSYFHVPADHPLYLELTDVAARLDVPIDIHMEAVPEAMDTPQNLRKATDKNPARLPASIPAFEKLLSHNRKTRIVWQHIGWDNSGFMTVELLRRLLTDHSNLHLSLRVERRPVQVQTREPMPNRIVDAKGQIKAEWLKLLQDFPDRVVIGSDDFVGSSGPSKAAHGSYAETWALIDQLPGDLAKKIGRENALRIYGLK